MTLPINPAQIAAHTTAMPDPSSESTFGARMQALFNWFVGVFRDGANTLASNTYQNALAAAEAAEAALMVSGATVWNAATNYATGAAVVSELDLQTYRRNAPGGVDATDPSASALWTLVGDKCLRKAGDTVTGNLQFSAGTGYMTATQHMNGHPSHSSSLAQHTPIFRNLVPNANTLVGAVANGSGAMAGWYAKLESTVSDRWGGLTISNDGVRVHSSASNTLVTAVPIYFTFKGIDRANVSSDGVFNGYGMRGRQGTAGSRVGNAVNLYWTGTQLQAWVDTTNQGVVTLTSDYRIKSDVRPMAEPAIGRVLALRPVVYRYADNEALSFKGDDREREGFIAHELAAVIPSAVEGEKDAEHQVQSLRVDALLAVLVRAVQEQQAQIEELRDQLKGATHG